MSTGKSKVIVDLVVNFDLRHVLIIAPLSVVAVWPKQFATHAAKEISVTALDDGSVESKALVAQRALQRADVLHESCVIAVNYESAWRDAFAKFALKQKWDLVVLDESHRIKSPSGRSSLFCAQLRDRAVRRICLTGTPMPHSPLDCYAQYRFLDPGVFGTSFVKFRSRYAQMGGYGGYQVLGYQNEDELNQKFYSLAYRVTKDVLDLPESVHMTRTCRLSESAHRTYESLQEGFYAEVLNGTVTITNCLVRLLRLQQMTSGHITDDDGAVSVIDHAKELLLEDVLEDLAPTEPVVVFCRFHHDLDVVREVASRLDRRCLELSGRRNELKAWQDGNAEILGVQIQSGGVGIDLTRARYAIYYSLGFSLGDYEQSLARIHRPGQTRTTTYLHLIVEGTVDERVYNALAARKEVVEFVLTQIRTEHDQPALLTVRV